MKVSCAWLQSYFADKLPPPEELAHILTFHSFEIEGVEKVGADTVIDVDVLPNRSSDCLCHRGIARELATLLGRDLKDDPLAREVLSCEDAAPFTVTVTNPELVNRFSAVLLSGVSVGPSPAWLRERLEAIGQRSINNIVDATNYVMFDIGQPMHAFDADKLAVDGGRRRIEVRVARDGETMTTLDGVERTLSPANLLITDGVSGRPLGIAGVKGGVEAEIDENTENIILEAANFNFVSVRKTSQSLKIQTDASVRFQNQPSPALTLHALREAASLLGGFVRECVDEYPAPREAKRVVVNLAQINNLLGTDLTSADVCDILGRFNFSFTCSDGVFSVEPPIERTDIVIPEDVIEEIGRVYGYEHIAAQPLPEQKEGAIINKDLYYRDAVRKVLTELGFSEVYTHALQAKGELELENALASDRPFLRSTLVDGLSASLELNAHNADLLGLADVRVFEIGTVFSKEKESVMLGLGVRAKGKGGEAKADVAVSFALEKLGEELGTQIEGKPQGGVVEVDFEELLGKLPEPQTLHEPLAHQHGMLYQPFSIYPFALRDIALWVPTGTGADAVLEVLREAAGELLVNAWQFDEYEKDGKVSYAFHLVFQSSEKTLSDEDINAVMAGVEKAVLGRSWEIR